MPTGNMTMSGVVGGIAFSSTVSRSASGQFGHEKTLAAATSGTLTTRTDNDTGVFTGSNHGLVNGDVIDIYWSTGRRYGAVVDSVVGNAVTFGQATPGSGDNLPSQGTAMNVCKETVIDSDWDGDKLVQVAVHSTKRACIQFLENGGATIKQMDLAADELFSWQSAWNVTNPFTGNPVGQIKMSNGETSSAVVKIGGVYQSDS